MFQRLTNWFASQSGDDTPLPLHSIDRMRAILERERMRADRGNSCFALLSLTLSPRMSREQLKVLSDILANRIRVTDDAGMLRTGEIGVVLPETPASGGWKLAKAVLDDLPTNFDPPMCQVFVHPTMPHDEVTLSEQSVREQGQPAGDQEPIGQPMAMWFVQPSPRWKRALDIAGSSIGLLLASPILIVTAIAIKATSRGPIIFSQPRDTLGGRRFNIYKFRTMVVDAEEQKAALRKHSEQDGPAFKMAHDPRITPLGRFLRKSSIDELPQLFNVLLGDMSLVGPRPLPCDESAGCQSWQRRRLEVMPGLTCIWQVYGRSRVSFAEWIRMDIRYARSRSLIKDVLLIVRTVPAVLFRRGAR